MSDRYTRESGEVDQDDGKLVRWTVVKGQSADGKLVWQEKWWETSDAWGYRELGAEKSGKRSDGSEWSQWYEIAEATSMQMIAVTYKATVCLQVGGEAGPECQ